MSIIEIDTELPCTKPRLTPDERAAEAVTQLAFEMITLRDAVKAGAVLSPQMRHKLGSLAIHLNQTIERMAS